MQQLQRQQQHEKLRRLLLLTIADCQHGVSKARYWINRVILLNNFLSSSAHAVRAPKRFYLQIPRVIY